MGEFILNGCWVILLLKFIYIKIKFIVEIFYIDIFLLEKF